MAQEYEKLDLKERTVKGKSKARSLRRDGMVPGVYYFRGEENVDLQIDKKKRKRIKRKKKGYREVEKYIFLKKSNRIQKRIKHLFQNKIAFKLMWQYLKSRDI